MKKPPALAGDRDRGRVNRPAAVNAIDNNVIDELLCLVSSVKHQSIRDVIS